MTQATTVPQGNATRPLGPSEDAIARLVIEEPAEPDWADVLRLMDDYYDELAEQDLELRLAGMQFPS